MLVTVLGPLQVMAGDGDEPVSVSAARLRVLLAVLLWRVNQPVAVDRLAEMVWDGAPPDGVAVAVRGLVKRLRRVLGEQAGARVVTRSPGYLIELSGDELDVSRFEALCRNAGDAARAGQWAVAGQAAAAALELWRGTPLADVPSQLLRDQWVPHLEQARMQVLEWRIEADLHEGRHEQLIGELREVVARHPLREHFHAQLMLALARAGRQAEALTAYKQARAALVSELGIEPGPELRRVHERILAGDALLVTPSGSAAPVVPQELPGAVRHFTGRETELTALTALTGQDADQVPGTVVISAIGGSAGVGKTALAVHWAHRVADRFPDGQLYVNLRGYDPGEPMPAADALAGFLRALGVPGQDIPADADQRAARYRSLLAGRRVLVVLDNAGSPEQVRPLLPGTLSCVTLVTSRDSLPGLAARDGAVRLDLDVLSPADALSLLRALLGARVDNEPDVAAALAEQCCRLPLALRVAAELAIARPATSLAHLAAELDDQQQRLDQLEAGADPRTAVRTVFSWSYQRLDAAVARAFRLLGLHPGPDFDPYVATALTGTPLSHAERLLGLLARAYLIQPTRAGRHGMHDLLRAYARELAARDDEGPRAAVGRLFDHYLRNAGTAADILFPADRHLRPRIPATSTPSPPMADADAARDWLEQELANLVAVTGHATGYGWPDHAIRLSAVLFRYLNDAGHIPEALIVHGHALDAARRLGDRSAEANALRNLGDAELAQGRHQEAFGHMTRALTLSREAGDQVAEARTLCNIGLIHLNEGRYGQAAVILEECLILFQETGDRFGQSRALGNLGAAKRRLGHVQEAAGHYQQALALARQIGDQSGQAETLSRLGMLNLRQDRHEQAAGQLQEALALFRQIHEPPGVARALLRLGELSTRQQRYTEAADQLQQSLQLFREDGDKPSEATALNRLGEASRLAGQPDHARAWYAAALELATQTGMRYEQAHAHDGLARGFSAAGDVRLARRHWQEALTIFTDIGAPEADQVRAELAASGH